MASPSGPDARMRAIEKDLAAARRGDWEARHRVEREMLPLLTNLARSRATQTAEINRLLECGKTGIAKAIRKFKPGTPGDRFQLFALPFIEQQMDKPVRSGFLARLLGR